MKKIILIVILVLFVNGPGTAFAKELDEQIIDIINYIKNNKCYDNSLQEFLKNNNIMYERSSGTYEMELSEPTKGYIRYGDIYNNKRECEFGLVIRADYHSTVTFSLYNKFKKRVKRILNGFRVVDLKNEDGYTERKTYGSKKCYSELLPRKRIVFKKENMKFVMEAHQGGSWKCYEYGNLFENTIHESALELYFTKTK